jgi:hypothetical protein
VKDVAKIHLYGGITPKKCQKIKKQVCLVPQKHLKYEKNGFKLKFFPKIFGG